MVLIALLWFLPWWDAAVMFQHEDTDRMLTTFAGCAGHMKLLYVAYVWKGNGAGLSLKVCGCVCSYLLQRLLFPSPPVKFRSNNTWFFGVFYKKAIQRVGSCLTAMITNRGLHLIQTCFGSKYGSTLANMLYIKCSSHEGFGNIPLGSDIISYLLPCEPSDLLQSILWDFVTSKWRAKKPFLSIPGRETQHSCLSYVSYFWACEAGMLSLILQL